MGTRIEVAPVQLPGRETRRSAAPFPDWNTLVNGLIHGLAPFLEPPFAFFGHSFGAFVAFEVARGLARRGAPMTDCLLVSAARAPHLLDPDPSIQRLPDADFIERVRRLNGIPDQVLGNKELLDIFLPSFFFSSRRRHTSFSRDWSSDVCSSDLAELVTWNPPPSLGSSETVAV